MFRRLLGRMLTRGAPSDDEIARELEDHLDLEAESLRGSSGMVPSEAPFAAARRFGNVTGVQEAVRDVWRWDWLDQLSQDVRHGARALARSPAYSVAVIVTLAMGIGAGAATYSLSRAIHNPFPRLPQHKLLWITQTSAACAPDCTEVSPAGFAALRTRAPSMTPVGVSGWSTTLRTAEGSVPVRGYLVSPNAFDVLEAPFATGRGFPNDAGQLGGARLAVLSYEFWVRQFAASHRVVDSIVTLGGDPYRIIGVLGKDVIFPMAADAYAPSMPRASEASVFGSHNYMMFARLTPGATLASAAGETRAIGADLVRESPSTDSGWVLRARPIADFHTDDVAVLEEISAVAALLVFIAACMSAANLGLSRLAARRHELALRAALGVRRWRLMRHLLAEAVLLALGASALGTAFARWAVHAMREAIPASFAAFIPGWARINLDAGALVVALTAAGLAVLAFGVLPSLRATNVDLTSALSDGGRASTGGVRSARTRATLIVLEVSTALVLLTAATLLARSVRNMASGSAGVRIDHTLVMELTMPRGMSDSATIDFYRRLDATLHTGAGIRAAGVATATPLSNGFSSTGFDIPGRAPAPKGHDLNAIDQHVTPGYADASGFHIVSGRMIDASDVSGAQHVIVVNEMMADAFWPHESAIGRLVDIDSTQWTVVGVSSNVHHGGLDEPMRYTVYRSIFQTPQPYGVVAVWTSGDPNAMRDAVRQLVARADASVALGSMMTMQQMQARHMSPYTMMATMLALLAAVTMTIAVVGLYGLIAYGVAQRTRELGVRIALGARPLDLLAHVALGAMRLTIIALAFGIVGAALFARLLGALLYRVAPGDPTTYAAVAASLLGVSLIAALIPSARAARVDPILALRGE